MAPLDARSTVLLLNIALLGCGPSGLEVLVRTDVGQVDFLSAAVFGSAGVLTRIDRLPASGAPTLPARLTVDLAGRTGEPLTLMLWGHRGEALVGFADLVLDATGRMEATLVVPSADADSDEVPDRLDRCRFFADRDQPDSDRDGSGDVCGCRDNVFPGPTFSTTAAFTRWADRENSTLTLVDGAMRVCRTNAGSQFGTTSVFQLPADARELELSAVLRALSGSANAGPLLRQGTNCSSWGSSCAAGGIVDPAPLSAMPITLRTRLKPSGTGALELELTSYDMPLSTCFDVQKVCLVVTKP